MKARVIYSILVHFVLLSDETKFYADSGDFSPPRFINSSTKFHQLSVLAPATADVLYFDMYSSSKIDSSMPALFAQIGRAHV